MIENIETKGSRAQCVLSGSSERFYSNQKNVEEGNSLQSAFGGPVTFSFPHQFHSPEPPSTTLNNSDLLHFPYKPLPEFTQQYPYTEQGQSHQQAVQEQQQNTTADHQQHPQKRRRVDSKDKNIPSFISRCLPNHVDDQKSPVARPSEGQDETQESCMVATASSSRRFLTLDGMRPVLHWAFDPPNEPAERSQGHMHGQECLQTPTSPRYASPGSSVELREDFYPELSQVEQKSTLMDSPGDSLDSDMLSISSEDTDCVGPLDPEGTLASTINQISHRIFAEYKESKGLGSMSQWAMTGSREKGGDSDKSGSSGSSSNQSEPCEASHPNDIEDCHTGKRSRPNDEDGDGDWDDGGFRRPRRPTKRPTRSSNRPCGRIMACPFWKFKPQSHRNCFRLKCSRIGDVKQHLARKHKQPAPEYCQRCWTPFWNEAQKKAHLSDETGQICKYTPSARPVGIDNTMAAALHKKSNPKQSTVEQWFAVWDIVFPDQLRPPSPYVDDNLTEDAAQLVEIIINQWPSILATELEGTREFATSENMDRLGREHLIRETLARLSDDFSTEQTRTRGARAADCHQSPGSRRQTPSSSVHADSAIEFEPTPSNLYSSAGSSDGTSKSFSRPAIPRLETESPVRSQSSAMHNRRERFILPQSQKSSDLIHDHQQQMQIPPPMTSSGTMLSHSLNARTTEFYGIGHFLENELTTNDLFTQLSEDSALQSLLERDELDTNPSFQNMGALPDFDWPSLES